MLIKAHQLYCSDMTSCHISLVEEWLTEVGHVFIKQEVM